MSYGRGAALLSALIGVTGLLTYAFHSLAAHALGREGYGVIGVLWAAVFLTASVIYRPGRAAALAHDRRARGARSSIGSALRVAATIQLGLAVAVRRRSRCCCATRSRTSCSPGTRPSTGLVAAVIFYAASYFARGFLAGQRRFGLYGGLVMMESASRVVLGVLLVVGVLDGDERRRRRDRRRAAAEPAAWCRGRSAATSPAPAPRPRRRCADEPEFTLSHGLGFAGAVLVIMVSEQAILNSGVLIVKVETGSNALAALIFAVLMIARAPLQLFQAVSTTLLPHLTRLVVTESRRPHAGEFGRSVRVTVVACLAFGAPDGDRRAHRGPGGDAAAVRLAVRLRPRRPRAGRGRHGPLSRRRRRSTRPRSPRAVRALAAASWARSAAFFVAFLLIAHMERCARSRSPSSPPRRCCPACSTSSTGAPSARTRLAPGSAQESSCGWRRPTKARRGTALSAQPGDRAPW